MPQSGKTSREHQPTRRILVATSDPALNASIDSLIDPGPTRRFVCSHAVDLGGALDSLQREDADAVLYDLDLEGDEAVTAVRKLVHTGKAPIIILTKVGNESLSLRCLEEGAQEYLDRDDLDTVNLRRALGYAISRHRANNLRLRLEHSDKLAALGQLTAGVAHEINNPATYVLSNLRQIEEVVGRLSSGKGNPGDLELIADMAQDCRRGVDLIASISRELKCYARTDDAAYEQIDIGELISNTSAMTLNEIRYRARFEKHIGDVPNIVGSRSKLSQILVNLLINATHAIQEGKSSENLIRISCDLEGENIVIRVKDTGCGIPEISRDKIFEAYYTTKEHGLGTGLGLPICREIATLHEGTLDFESTVDEGTVFLLTLPVQSSLRAPVVAQTEPTERVPPNRNKRMRVLLIDDEPLLLKSLARMLQAHHDVVATTGGALGIKALGEQDFDVIICDLMMPEVDGLHVYEKLTETYPELIQKLVYLSGGVFTDRMSSFLDETKPRLLDKPVSRDALLSAIGDLALPG
ncbi:MAG: response regulator [Myxococcales bacterium]|nr:response regulator [Myxococcales bacterium]